MEIYDTWTESGRLLQDGYDRLIKVNYDPDCEMVDVLNDYSDLPKLECDLDSLKNAMDKIVAEYEKLEEDVSTRLSELKNKIFSAEITEIEE